MGFGLGIRFLRLSLTSLEILESLDQAIDVVFGITGDTDD